VTDHKKNKRNIGDVVDRHLGLFNSAPAQEMNEAEERIFRRLHEATDTADSSPAITFVHRSPKWRRWRTGLLLAGAAMIIFLVIFVRTPLVRSLKPGSDAHAAVESADGGLFRVSGGQALQKGNQIELGEMVRTDGGIGTILALADGSRIEMRPQSTLSLELANDGIRIRLDRGGIIVAAAKQVTGHLYVQTKDVTVSVIGTVFLVNAEEAGSRVAVIQGEVFVQQGAIAKKLLPGEQVTTNPLMESHPVIEQFSWSREAETHIAMLQQSATSQSNPGATVQKKLEFEAASLRELQPGGQPSFFLGCRGIDGLWSYDRDVAGFGGSPDTPQIPQGRCIASTGGMTFIASAYGIPLGRLSGGSPLGFYRLDATAENTATVTTVQLREMLQNLVIDRFKLKAHRYTEERPGYFLVVAKGGPKFKETSGDEELPRPRVLGAFGQGSLPTQVKGKFSLKNFAQFLSSASMANDSRPVVDMTGLTGIYEISLVLHQKPSFGPRGGGGASEMWDPPIGDALEDQLGLRLESAAKIPLEYLAVDHIEKPSEN
jgi:uncharacterized protein (TIGR03435 family)